jgi:hypothetical protein
MKKIAIVVNKNWEAEPMLAAMCSGPFRAAGLPFPSPLLSLKDGLYRVDPKRPINDDANVRAIFILPQLTCKVWCIQDFMDSSKNSSSSEEKARFLPALLQEEAPDLIVAVGTAGYLAENAIAGCVVAGTRFFVHDGHPGNPLSNYQNPLFDSLLPLNCNPKIFGLFSPASKLVTESKFLKPPNNPAIRPALLASPYYTALSSVNVTDYGEYAWVDGETVSKFRNIEKKLPIGSLETTHGVIRLCSDYPAMFISAITDSEGNFDIEVTAGQNYTAAFNAGIMLGQLLMDVNALLITNNNFDFRNA